MLTMMMEMVVNRNLTDPHKSETTPDPSNTFRYAAVVDPSGSTPEEDEEEAKKRMDALLLVRFHSKRNYLWTPAFLVGVVGSRNSD